MGNEGANPLSDLMSGVGDQEEEAVEPNQSMQNGPEDQASQLQAQAISAYNRRRGGVPKPSKVPSPGLGGKGLPKAGPKTSPKKYSYPEKPKAPRRRKPGAQAI